MYVRMLCGGVRHHGGHGLHHAEVRHLPLSLEHITSHRGTFCAPLIAGVNTCVTLHVPHPLPRPPILLLHGSFTSLPQPPASSPPLLNPPPPTIQDPSFPPEACLHSSGCMFFLPLHRGSSACSIGRWLRFLLRVDRRGLLLTLHVYSICAGGRNLGQGLELASDGTTLFLQALLLHTLGCGAC